MVNKPEDTDPYILIEKLAAKFPKTSFVLTLGVRGSVLKLKERNDVISCKSFKVKAVDTTGAGDTFLGYLIANLAANADPKLALKTAAASAIAVTRKGAAPSIPLKEEVMEFLAKNKDEVLTDKI